MGEVVLTGTNASCRGAGLHLSREAESSHKAALSAGRAVLEPVGSPPLAAGLSSGNSAGSQFGRAVQSFTSSVILEIIGNLNKLNLSAALRTLACQLHPC